MKILAEGLLAAKLVRFSTSASRRAGPGSAALTVGLLIEPESAAEPMAGHGSAWMFVVGVSDHIMIAHSLRGETFGPAQRLHGATYEVKIEVLAPALDADGIVVDIGLLRTVLRETLAQLEYQNLDELPQFSGENTTTEFLCRWLHGALSQRLGPRPDAGLRVTLVESPNAWAGYEAALGE